MRLKNMAATAAICAGGLMLAGCNQQQASNTPPAPAPAAAPAPATAAGEAMAPAADISPESNKKYLDDNAKRAGVKVTADGLQYRVIKAGTGKTATAPTDNVTVTYKGALITGQVFDQTM